MVSKDDAQTTYTTARNKLLDIVTSINATEEQINTASAAAEKLAMEFLGKEYETFEALSASYQRFIDYMQKAIAHLEKDGPIEVVAKLKNTLSDLKPGFSEDPDER
jgi:hypothetical protein